MHDSKVLVTGGAGFIGSHLVDRLIREGHRVTVLDNFLAGKMKNLQTHLSNKRFRLLRGDVRNLRDVRKAVKDATAVFHLAAIVDVPLSIENPTLTNDVNVGGTLNILETSLAENVDRFIYVSTCAVYGDAHHLPIDEEQPTAPLSPYGVSKLAAENYCEVYDLIHRLKTVRLRFFNVYGPRQHAGPYSGVITQFIHKLEKGESPVIYGDGQQTRDFINVLDVVDACMLAMESANSKGETFNIGTGSATTIDELANVLIELFGKTALTPIYKEPREGDIKKSYADISKARKMLNFEPKIGLKNGIKLLLNSKP